MAMRILHGTAYRRRPPLHKAARLLLARALLASMLLVALVGCAHIAAPWSRRPVEDEVQRQREQLNQLVAYHRMADIGALVADDVQVIAPAKIISGKKNLVRSYEGLVQKRPDLVQIFTPERVERNPRWKFAAERGRWSDSWQEQGEAVEISGSYYALWKLKDGHWRLYSQIVTPVSCKGARYCKSME